MRWLREVAVKLRAVFRRTQVEQEMEAELAEHLQSEIDDLVSRGMLPAEARRRALAGMGRIDRIAEECRDARGTVGWEQFRRDVGFALRLLAKNRTFAVTALATMAVGIGSTTAVSSLVQGLLIRPLPYPAAHRLMHSNDLGMRGPFEAMRRMSRQAEYGAYLGLRSFTVRGQEGPERAKGTEVSANLFRVLGVPPFLGRAFREGEERPGKWRVVLLSHNYWTEHFQARPDVIGKPLMLDEVAYEIVGVMPPGFAFPAAGAEMWIPMRLNPQAAGDYWGTGGVSAVARLRDGVTRESAEAELRAAMPAIRAMFPWRMPDAWGSEVSLLDLRDFLVSGIRLRSLLLLAVAALVLMISVVNVANLMVGQTAGRTRELALRASMGASPGRLARQLLTESLVLGVLGGAAGTLLAYGELDLLEKWLPAETPRLTEVSIDTPILLFTAALSLGSGLLFGLLPAWAVRTKGSLAAGDESRSTTGHLRPRADAVLVLAEVTFATVLLVGAGLVMRSLWSMLDTDPGIRTTSLVTAEVSLGREAKTSLAKTLEAWDRVSRAIAAYPGVRRVTAANILPLTPEISAISSTLEDHPRAASEPQFSLWTTAVTPEHLDNLGIRILRGRGFTAADRMGAPPVVLISRAMAERFWPGRDPVGRRLRPVYLKEWWTIAGVVENIKNYSLSGPPEWVDGEIYTPLAQATLVPMTLQMVAHVDGDSAQFERALRGNVQSVCPVCAVSRISRMDALLDRAVAVPRAVASLVGGFALLALLLAASGIYGVVTHAVQRRTRELGVRLALGASRTGVAWLVMSASLRSTLAGAAVGLVAAWMLSRWIRSLLFGVAEHDWFSFVLPPLLLALVALLASLVPMSRAVRIDPAQCLREG